MKTLTKISIVIVLTILYMYLEYLSRGYFAIGAEFIWIMGGAIYLIGYAIKRRRNRNDN